MPYRLPELPPHIAEALEKRLLNSGLRRRPRFFRDTGNFTAIDYGDVVEVDNRYFLITGYTREGRFGVDDQPKMWVPKVEDLGNGASHILKFVFHEQFDITMGTFTVHCYRNPEKEAKVLDLVRGHERFMQGYTALDEGGNMVRILDVIRGRRLDKHIYRRECSHEVYFHEELPGILQEFIGCIEAIGFLHSRGFKHGDIRRDHVYVEFESGRYRWIDFDYDFYLPERPFAMDVYELGNILLFLTGRGNHNIRDILEDPDLGEEAYARLADEDFSLLAKNRVVNLRKLFPYIPKQLNDIFMHFSQESTVFYDSAAELHQDLGDCLAGLA